MGWVFALVVVMGGCVVSSARQQNVYKYNTELCINSNNKEEECKGGCKVEASLAVTSVNAVTSVRQAEAWVHSLVLSPPKIECNGKKVEHEKYSWFGDAVVLVEDEKIKEVYASKETSDFVGNILLGIAKMFEHSAESQDSINFRGIEGETEFERTRQDGGKIKVVTSTKPRPSPDPSATLLGVKKIQRSEVVLQFREDGTMERMDAEENVDVVVALKTSLGARISSRQTLAWISSSEVEEEQFKKHVEEVKTEGKYINWDMMPQPAVAQEEEAFGKFVDKNLGLFKANNLATYSAVQVFQQAIGKIRAASPEDIKNVLIKKKNQKVLPQLLDAIGSAGSSVAHKVVMERKHLMSEKNQKDLERYFIALGIHGQGKHLVDALFETVKKIPKDRKELHETALYALCSVAGKSNVAAEMSNQILELGGGKKECEDSACHRKMIKCITALGDHSYLGKLLQQVKSKKIDKKMKELSLKTLGKTRLIQHEQKSKVENELLKIFLQKHQKFDSTQRMNALDSILDLKPNTATLLNLIHSLDPQETEMSCYTVQKLHNHVTNNEVESWLKDKIANYDLLSLSHMGLSTNVEKNIAKLDHLTTAFSFSMEMNKNALKRTSFSLKSGDNSGHVELLRLDSAIGGLSSFLGEEDPEDDKEANAAIELTLLSLPLRPVTLFSSLGDLMEIYWSGAAQEKMTALQGTVLLQDDSSNFLLSNGIQVGLDMMGGLSFDLSGKADISIWSRTGNTLVENKAAVLVKSKVFLSFGGEAEVEGGEEVKVETELSAEAQLDVDTDVDMSGAEVLACIRMSQRQFMVTERHRVNGQEESYDIFVPGLTWNLNAKNNELCNKMRSQY